jgi:hypothetical protein
VIFGGLVEVDLRLSTGLDDEGARGIGTNSFAATHNQHLQSLAR